MSAVKGDDEIKVFVLTFVVAFLVIVSVATPTFAYMGRTFPELPFIAVSEPEPPAISRLKFDYLIPEDSPFFDNFTEVEKVNIIIIGVNQGLTDTIILASLDTKNKRVDLIWVPRDTYYYRPGYYGEAERKINAAFRNNPLNTAKAVHEVLLGIPINYYILLDYEGVAEIVDSMGGVPMDIPFNMVYSDPRDKPPLYINIPKGEQILYGDKAIQFLRYRSGYPEGDLGRVKAQQQFMINAFKRCISFELPKIATTVFENVTTDLKLRSVLYIAKNGVGITGEDISTYTMPGWADPDPPYYVHPRAREIADMLTEIYSIDKTEEAEEEV